VNVLVNVIDEWWVLLFLSVDCDEYLSQCQWYTWCVVSAPTECHASLGFYVNATISIENIDVFEFFINH
jgi:hypothetical protein